MNNCPIARERIEHCVANDCHAPIEDGFAFCMKHRQEWEESVDEDIHYHMNKDSPVGDDE